MSLSEYGPIASLVGHAYDFLSSMSTTRLILFLLVNIPILSIIGNVIYQLVRILSLGSRGVSLVLYSFLRTNRCLQWSGIGSRGLAQLLRMERTQLSSSLTVRRRYATRSFGELICY